MNSWIRRIGGSLLSRWDAIRGSYWFFPMLMVVLAVASALALIELDRVLVSRNVRPLPWIHDTGAEGTRALLSTVAGSMITVTGVTFSITIVALTLASSQFGPRLLRNFLRDRGNQLVLGTFVATFVYTLLVLRAVEAEAVPYVATTVAIGLTITSVFVLIYFVHHAASSIQASTVIANVASEIEGGLANLFPEEIGRGAQEVEIEAEVEPGEAFVVHSPGTGYVRVVSGDALLALATERDLEIRLSVRPGDFVSEGEAIAAVRPAERCSDDLPARVSESVVLGDHRTAVQDIEFLTDQLCEMAIRALSPGTNDPRTAVLCVHRLGIVIATVGQRVMPSSRRYDDHGVLRIVAEATTFEGIVASCLDPIRRYGIGDGEVVEAVVRALASAIRRCPVAARRRFLTQYAREWADDYAAQADPPRRDRARVSAAFEQVAKAIDESARADSHEALRIPAGHEVD